MIGRLNEEMIETLFLSNTGMTTKEMSGGQINPPMNQESRILEPKKSQNIAILLKALNVNKEEVCEALLEGIPSTHFDMFYKNGLPY